MKPSISQLATDPSQYDKDEIIWNEEGKGLSPIRRVFLEKLSPHLENLYDKTALELGCGQGWLCQEMQKRGAEIIGIDPSRKNIKTATEQYPDIKFEQSDLQQYNNSQNFDLITAIMVFEHFPNLIKAYEKIKSLLKENGRLLMITGDFNKFTKPRHDYTVEAQKLTQGEVATRTDYGARAGIIYDINRTTDRFIKTAQQVGFALKTHEPIPAPEWLIKEQPRYSIHNGEPLFHLLKFEPKS